MFFYVFFWVLSSNVFKCLHLFSFVFINWVASTIEIEFGLSRSLPGSHNSFTPLSN